MTVITLGLAELQVSPLEGDDRLPLLRAGDGRPLAPADEILVPEQRPRAAAPASLLPYGDQARFGRSTRAVTSRVATISNGRVSATVLLDLGGRLWTLAGEQGNVLCTPERIQLANLALRTAWFAGGIEWNLGITGHWPLTAAPVNAAVVETERGPVLRLWAFERLTELVWRLDLWLPADEDVLYVRPQLHNPHQSTRPLYWWTNIALPQDDDARLVVDAPSALTYAYANGLEQLAYPGEPDSSRPAEWAHAADLFFAPSDSETRWVAGLEGSGRGLLHQATAALRGRKLFTWGNGAGGEHWQQWLCGERRYYEMQAGLATTQSELLELAAGQTASWTEALVPVQATEALDGPMTDAVAVVGALAVPGSHLIEVDAFLAEVAGQPVDLASADLDRSGEAGWGALAVAVGDLPDDSSAPFAADLVGADQQPWLDLARGGPAPCTDSFATSSAWGQRLRAAAPGWRTEVHLGLTDWAAGDREAARQHWLAAEQTATLAGEPDDAVLLWCLAQSTDDANQAAEHLARALAADPGRVAPVTALAAHLGTLGTPEALLEACGALPPEAAEVPRVQLARAAALARLGQTEQARQIVDGPVVVPDLREGEELFEPFWQLWCHALGEDLPLPSHYDFRMNTTTRTPGPSTTQTSQPSSNPNLDGDRSSIHTTTLEESR